MWCQLLLIDPPLLCSLYGDACMCSQFVTQDSCIDRAVHHCQLDVRPECLTGPVSPFILPVLISIETDCIARQRYAAGKGMQGPHCVHRRATLAYGHSRPLTARNDLRCRSTALDARQHSSRSGLQHSQPAEILERRRSSANPQLSRRQFQVTPFPHPFPCVASRDHFVAGARTFYLGPRQSLRLH